MTASVVLRAGARLCHLPAGFRLAHGGVLDAAHVAFEVTGPAGAPLVAVLGGISAHRHVCADVEDARPGWWDGLVGPGRAIDTTRFRVLGIDWLGGCDASTGPEPDDTEFPAIDAADQARALAHVCDALGVERLHAIVGASYGGMVALRFAAELPGRVLRIVTVGAADRSLPWITAQRALQRRVVRLGVRTGAVDDALALARALGMTTYRSTAELETRFGAAPALGERVGEARFPIEDWLDAHGARFVTRFTPAAYLCLSESIDRHVVDAVRIGVPATLVGLCGDLVVPPEQVRSLAARVAGPARYVEVASNCGHDGFLKDTDALAPIVARSLAEEVRR